jgi:hypothetical protein
LFEKRTVGAGRVALYKRALLEHKSGTEAAELAQQTFREGEPLRCRAAIVTRPRSNEIRVRGTLAATRTTIAQKDHL